MIQNKSILNPNEEGNIGVFIKKELVCSNQKYDLLFNESFINV